MFWLPFIICVNIKRMVSIYNLLEKLNWIKNQIRYIHAVKYPYLIQRVKIDMFPISSNFFLHLLITHIYIFPPMVFLQPFIHSQGLWFFFMYFTNTIFFFKFVKQITGDLFSHNFKLKHFGAFGNLWNYFISVFFLSHISAIFSRNFFFLFWFNIDMSDSGQRFHFSNSIYLIQKYTIYAWYIIIYHVYKYIIEKDVKLVDWI